MSKITELTLVPISLVLIIIGGVVYVVSGFAESNALKERLNRVEMSQVKYYESVVTISERLSKIEGALGVRKNRGN